MENEVPDQTSVASDELLIDIVLVKRGEDLVCKQTLISQTLFQQSPKSAASKILSQIDTKFLPKEQSFIELAISTHSGLVRTNNLNRIYVYIVITEVDGDEKVTACMPMIFLKKPCEIMNEEFKTFSGNLMTRIQNVESKFKHRLRKVHVTIHKYGDSMLYEEINDDSETGQDCSVCLIEYTIGSQAIRLPCDHLFCAKCIIRWLIHNGSCPLCRYRLIMKSVTLIQ